MSGGPRSEGEGQMSQLAGVAGRGQIHTQNYKFKIGKTPSSETKFACDFRDKCELFNDSDIEIASRLKRMTTPKLQNVFRVNMRRDLIKFSRCDVFPKKKIFQTREVHSYPPPQ